MTHKEIFESELAKHNLKWCRSCNASRGHKRGFVLWADRITVHLDSEVATRSTLHRALHEIGHCVNDEKGLRSFEREAMANKFADNVMRENGISVPRKVSALSRGYVQRKKRHGDNIRAGK